MSRPNLNLAAIRSSFSLQDRGIAALAGENGNLYTRRQFLKHATLGAVASAPLTKTLVGSSLGRYSIKTRPGYVKFSVSDGHSWCIDINRFGGRPVLDLERNDERVTVRLTGAYFPGTHIPADLIAVLSPSFVGTGILLKMAFGGFEGAGDLEPWIAGYGRLSSRVHANYSICRDNDEFVVRAAGAGIAEFYPNWVLKLAGEQILSWDDPNHHLHSDQMEIRLPEPADPSPFRRKANKRSQVRFVRDSDDWDVDTNEDRSCDRFRVLTDRNAFDVAILESRENKLGVSTHACVFSGLHGAAIAVGAHPPTLSRQSIPLLPLKNIQYGIASGSTRASFILADVDDCWIGNQHGSIRIDTAVGKPGLKVEFADCTFRNIQSSLVLKDAVISLDGAVAQWQGPSAAEMPVSISDFELDLALHNESARISLASPPGGPTIRISSPTIRVLRPDDLVSLDLEYLNLTLDIAPRRPPILVPTDPTQPVQLSVMFSPQHIVEEVYFEQANITTTPPTNVNPVDSPPVGSRSSGPSRLVFYRNPPHDVIAFELSTLLDWSSWTPKLSITAGPADGDPLPTQGPQKPANNETSIEYPYRMMLSPNRLGVWTSELQPKFNDGPAGASLIAGVRWAELWHTSLSASSGEPQIRAIWTTAFGDNPTPPNATSQSTLCDVPQADSDNGLGFTADMTDGDREQLVYLMTGFGVRNPSILTAPTTANQLMLSALGATADLRGAWPWQNNFSIIQWRQIGSQGRDNYQRIVYAGFLFPFGFAATLTQVTERRFQSKTQDGPLIAYLRQKTYITVIGPDMHYGNSGNPKTDRQLPFQEIFCQTDITPDLDDPTASGYTQFDVPNEGFCAFLPTFGKQPFQFSMMGTDNSGNACEFTSPVVFLSNLVKNNPTVLQGAWSLYNTYAPRVPLGGQIVSYTKEQLNSQDKYDGKSALQTSSLTFSYGSVPVNQSDPHNTPPDWAPIITSADVIVPAIAALSNPGNGTTTGFGGATITYWPTYLNSTYSDPFTDPLNSFGQIFAQFESMIGFQLPTGTSAANSPSLILPHLNFAGLSRIMGAIGPDLSSIAQGINPRMPSINASSFIDLGGSMIFGIVPLKDVFSNPLTSLTSVNVPNTTAEFIYDNIDGQEVPVGVKATWTWTAPIPEFDVGGVVKFTPGEQPAVITVVVVSRADTESTTASVNASLTDFHVEVLNSVDVYFASLVLTSQTGQKTNADARVNSAMLKGDLQWVGGLANALGSFGDNGFKIDLQPTSLTAALSLALPDASCGLVDILNISFSAGLTLPFFGGTPLTLSFAFATRDNPFQVAVMFLSGGGYVGFTVGPDQLYNLEFMIEFGAMADLDLIVASGEVYIYAGIYCAYITNPADTQITGFLQAGGSLTVLDLITVSVEFYMGLTYDRDTGKVSGYCEIYVSVSVLFFSETVPIPLYMEFDGSSPSQDTDRALADGGSRAMSDPDPNSRNPQQPLSFSEAVSLHDWLEYTQAFGPPI